MKAPQSLQESTQTLHSLNKATFIFRSHFTGSAPGSVREGFSSVLQIWEVGVCAEAGGGFTSTSAGAGQGLRYHLTLKAVCRLSASVSAVEILNFIHYMMKVIMGH